MDNSTFGLTWHWFLLYPVAIHVFEKKFLDSFVKRYTEGFEIVYEENIKHLGSCQYKIENV